MTSAVTPIRAPDVPGLPGEGHPTVAPLTNVAACLSAVRAARERTHGLPGLVVLHGPSGWGKSTAAAYTAVQLRAYYVQCQTLWSRADFIGALAREMGLPVKGTVARIADTVAEQLTLSDRPLLIDEAHVLVERATGAGALKDLHDSTAGTILLIGEEMLPQSMTRYERLHGRVLDWVSAQPCSVADSRALTRIYAAGVEIADDLLEDLARSAKGSVRRVCVNLDRIRSEARALGWPRVDRTLWGNRPIYTGEPPARRIGR
jgi:hypothetical protein